MSDIIERVAIAINEAVFGKAMDADPRSILMARAAIEAMREPTQKMLEAMEPWTKVSGHHDLVWRAGIDEALK